MAAFQFYPATSERWPDLESLFVKTVRMPAAGSFRMFWRLERGVFKKTKGEGNHQILKQIVEAYPIDMQSPELAGQASETRLIVRLKVRTAPTK